MDPLEKKSRTVIEIICKCAHLSIVKWHLACEENKHYVQIKYLYELEKTFRHFQ